MVVGVAATESRFLKRVTEGEYQLIDLNTEPRILTDGEGELIFSVLWSYVKELLWCCVDVVRERSC